MIKLFANNHTVQFENIKVDQSQVKDTDIYIKSVNSFFDFAALTEMRAKMAV